MNVKNQLKSLSNQDIRDLILNIAESNSPLDVLEILLNGSSGEELIDHLFHVTTGLGYDPYVLLGVIK